ncbi:MAG: hypothetical protein HKP58_19460 [Desulfatitalea sp.]|nr:hypothetical protein [Desulfatitalea sp.]NNK02595.1 hypothetical protein [Desulfatitalea sp.]
MASAARYCVVANPTSGTFPMRRRYALLKKAAAIFDARIKGLDTNSSEEFAQCLRDQAEKCDVMVIAGGDGTFSLAINTVDLSKTTLAFLPFGTGNALSNALGYRGGPVAVAERIHYGRVHRYDLIDCEGKRKSFMASLGIDGTAIGLYEKYRNKGYHGFRAHLFAVIRAYFNAYRPSGTWIQIDDETVRTEKIASFMVVKQPFYGMGLKVVPHARWDDHQLHTMTLPYGFFRIATALLQGFTIGNRIGKYRTGSKAIIRLDRPLWLQIDGELGWKSDRFFFTVLANTLRLKH